MPSIKLSGRVKKILPQETTPKGFTFQVMHLETDLGSQYPQVIEVQWSGKSLGLVDVINAGDEVEVEVNLRGRESNEKVYISLSGWRITKTGKADAAPVANAIDSYKAKGTSYETVTDSDIASDLPF